MMCNSLKYCCEINVNTFLIQAKDSWEMSGEEKIEQADISKTKGTNYFKVYKKYVISIQMHKVFF